MVSQAQRDELEGPIIDWVHNNPDTECNLNNGRRGLIVHVKNFYAANFRARTSPMPRLRR
jgi:hypothetical protein